MAKRSTSSAHPTVPRKTVSRLHKENIALQKINADLLRGLKDAKDYVENMLEASGEDSGEGAMIRLFEKIIAQAEGR